MKTKHKRYPAGQTIVSFDTLSKEELEREGWSKHAHVPVLVLSDGSRLFPARDYEGKGPGVLFGNTMTARGKSSFALIPQREAPDAQD